MAVTGIIIGAGNRGFIYADYALKNPENFKIVGVAEPRDFRRKKLASLHSVKEENVFEDWQEVAKRDRLSDCAIITTQDRMHKDPAIALAKRGYHIFLEKPMATSYEDCKAIVHACKEAGVMLAVGHVLRYHPHALLIRKLINNNTIGEVVNIQHMEPIGYWHFGHSFVRGNWSREAESSFLLLAKCCHDLDLIDMWMGGRTRCLKTSSFGSLLHFNKQNKPTGSSDRCVSCGVEESCPSSAKKLYLTLINKGYTDFPVSAITDEPTVESVTEALTNGPYGRCVYAADNDVCDNQVVILQYDNGATATMTTTAFTQKLCVRKVNICGTKGEIRCEFDSVNVGVYDFLTKETTEHAVMQCQGHKDCDFEAIKSFIHAVKSKDESLILTGADESLRSHKNCFAAEKARVEGRVVEVAEMDA